MRYLPRRFVTVPFLPPAARLVCELASESEKPNRSRPGGSACANDSTDRRSALLLVLLFQEFDCMTKIYVGNLPFSATDAEIRELFAAHGTVESVSIITDRDTGRPRGFGFVEMSRADASRAIQTLNGKELGGRPLRVNEAQERTGGGGGGGGGNRGGGGGAPKRW